MAELEVVLRPCAEVAEADFAALLAAAWPENSLRIEEVLQHSLCWVTAHVGERLVGFVNVAWDGGVHAFLLDTTVHPEFRRHGIGVSLVRLAADEARERGAEWLHVDYEPAYTGFYRRCGFRPTSAGLLDLRATEALPADRSRPLLRKYANGDAAACRTLMAGLGGWFGIPSATEAYLADLARVPTWVAVLDDDVVGFVSVTRPAQRSFEVHVLAVAAERHGQGIGRALMQQAERFATVLGARFMQVKTLGPSHADPHYAKTRGFYQALGYEPLFESERIWGEGNPAVVLVKTIG